MGETSHGEAAPVEKRSSMARRFPSGAYFQSFHDQSTVRGSLMLIFGPAAGAYVIDVDRQRFRNQAGNWIVIAIEGNDLLAHDFSSQLELTHGRPL